MPTEPRQPAVSPRPPEVTQPLDTDQADAGALRLRVHELEERLAAVDHDGPPGDRTGWWRPVVATVLIVIAAVAAPLSIVARWAHDEVGNTNTYVSSITPLATDPAVQSAVIDRVSREVSNAIDVKAVASQASSALAAQGFPAAATTLNALSGPLESSVEGFITEQVGRIVRSAAFADAWVAANRSAHTQLVAVLTGKDTDQVTVTGDAVQINLAAVINAVKQQLVANGFGLADKIPSVNATFTIFQSADLGKAQRVFSLLGGLATWLPVVGLLALAGAVFVARNRLRMLMIGALAIAVSMLVLGVGLNAFRSVYLNAVPTDQVPSAAAAAVYDALVASVRVALRAVLVVALAVAVGAWLGGSSASGVGARRGIARGAAVVRGRAEHLGLNTGPVGEFCFRYKAVLRGLVIGLGALVYVLASDPTPGWTLGVVIGVAVLLALLELLGRPPEPSASAGLGAPPAAPV
jgi:hypothetical protein